MKSCLRKSIRPLLLMVGMILIVISSSFLYYGNLMITGLSDKPEIEEELSLPKYGVPLSDTYGMGNKSLDQFLTRKHVLDELVEINEKLNQSENFTYYQLTEPSIYYIGEYKGRATTIVGGEEYRNQKDIETGEWITSINSLEIPENMVDQIRNQLEEGQSFSKGDFSLTYRDQMPVVLGYEFKKHFAIGDTLKLRYYLQFIDIKVIGFLEKGATINLPNISWDISSYIILPDIKIPKEQTSVRTQKNNIIMMLEKSEGYLGVNQIEQFPSVIEELEEINQHYDFAFNIDAIQKSFTNFEEKARRQYEKPSEPLSQEENTINIHNKLSQRENTLLRSLTVGGIILILLYLWLWIKNMKTCSTNERSVVYKTRNVVKLSLNVVICYSIAYILCKEVLLQVDNNFNSEFIMYPQSLIRLGILAVIIVGGILTCKKIDTAQGGSKTND
ncbi:Uncharacterised protein [uncultured Eubacterium sp.]|nr:Uncharacterised protein [uncultured Eubacterium sp.]